MNRVLRIATMLAAAGCAPPVTERVLRVREDGGVDDLEPGVHTGLDGRTVVVIPDSAYQSGTAPLASQLDTLHLGRERPETVFRAPPRRSRRLFSVKTTRPPKDRSKEKAARKARKKNRGR